jgi:hypothetical protein
LRNLKKRQIIPILEGALVDCLIEDPQAANFWKQYFLGLVFTLKKIVIHVFKEEAPWSEFYDKLAHLLGLNVSHENIDTNGKCLRKLVEEPAEIVAAERFGFVVNAFGPVVVNHKGFSILDKIRSAMASEWFHG